MGVRSTLRARPVLFALLGCVVLVFVGALVAMFVVARDEQRAGRILSTVLGERLGHPIRIARAATDGTSYLTLTGIRVPPAGTWTTDLAIREIRIEGPLHRAYLGPKGQHFRVRIVSTSVTLAQVGERPPPPTAAALEQIRGLVTRLLEWPATVSVGLSGGELRVRGQVTHFDLAGEKSADGKLGFRLTVRSEGGPALTVEGTGSMVNDVLAFRLMAEGDARALGGIWPGALPAMKNLSGVLTLRLPRPARLELDGQATLTPVNGEPPLLVSGQASYLPAESRLDLSKLAVGWGSRVALTGSGKASRLDGSPRLELQVEGSVAESPLRALVDLDAAKRTAIAEATLGRADVRRLFEQVGLAARFPQDLESRVGGARIMTELSWRPDVSLESARFRARLDGAVATHREIQLSAPVVQVVTTVAPVGADGLVAESSLLAEALEARLAGKVHRLVGRADARFRLPRAAQWRGLGALERARLTLSNPAGAAILEAGAEAPADGGSPQQIGVSASLPDLGRVPQLIQGLTYQLTGSARLDGRLGWSQQSALHFQGEARLQVPRATLSEFGVTLTDLAGTVPISQGIEGGAALGSLTMESLAAHGLTLQRFSALAQVQDGVLNLPEVKYVHYGGTGGGWIQAELTDPSLPVRMRFEGANVDLGRFFPEAGFQAAKISGQVRYVIGLIFTRPFGAEAAGQFQADPPGGVVSIDVLKGLIASAPESPLGIVRETLEGLSEFRYKSLEGQIYMDRRETHLSVSLQGQERLGIFPPKIRAITIENLPVSKVAAILGPHLRREP